MAAVEDREAGIGNEPLHDAGVDRRHDRVVFARHDQRRLAQEPKPRQAGPPERRRELKIVSTPAAEADVAQRARDQGAVAPEVAAVNVTRDAARVRGIHVAARRGHPEQHRRAAGHHERAGGSRREDKLAPAHRVAQRELLRDRATPRHAEHVDPADADMVEQTFRNPGNARGAVGRPRRWRTADAGHVEDDDRRSVQRVDERPRQLDVGAEPVQDEQRHARRIAGADAVADSLGPDLYLLDTHGVRRRRPRRWARAPCVRRQSGAGNTRARGSAPARRSCSTRT